jgi:hypothetical protein
LSVAGLLTAASCLLAAAEPAAAPAAAQEAGKQLTPLKVQVLLSRFDGEKKVSSMPYTLSVNASSDERYTRQVQLRMGVQVPLTTTSKEGGPTITYRDVGTNIDCSALTLEDGRFRLILTVSQSSVYTADNKPATGTSPTGIVGQPILRNFTSNFTPILRDAQTVQYMTATDPVSGEVLKIDVTVTVIK